MRLPCQIVHLPTNSEDYDEDFWGNEPENLKSNLVPIVKQTTVLQI